MYKFVLGTIVCLLAIFEATEAQQYRIGAWNIQRLGKTKMNKLDVVDVITQVMLRYDIIVIQEIVDVSLEVPYLLLDSLNEYAFDVEASPGTPFYETYDLALSDRQGVSQYKEQYAFFYRTNEIFLNATYQYPDLNETFVYNPFFVLFETPYSPGQMFAMGALHASPSVAEIEIDALVDAYDEVVLEFGIQDILLLGDFNADCNYVTASEWPSIRLKSDSRFDWFIPDTADTTVKITDCAYDRIVAAGSSLQDALINNSARTFYFDKAFHLADQDFIEDVSDHYPVEILLNYCIPSQT